MDGNALSIVSFSHFNNKFGVLYFLGLSLMWVAIMGVILIYIYALIGFAFFRASFDTGESRFCNSLAECFMTVLRYGAVGELTDVGLNFLLRIDCLIYQSISVHLVLFHAHRIVLKDGERFLLDIHSIIFIVYRTWLHMSWQTLLPNSV